jgi:DNA-binding MarR family transcriptional regulator
MVQAAAAGVVDFGRADPRSPKWWRYLRLILDQLEQKNLKEYHRLYNDRVVAILSRTDLTRESAERMLEESDSRIDSIAKVLFPWIELDRESVRKDEIQKLRAAWEDRFGKLDDPETQRRIRNTVEWLKNVKRPKAPGKGRR